MDEIELWEPPQIKEILAQQRLILEMHKELIKILNQPMIVYKSEVSNARKDK